METTSGHLNDSFNALLDLMGKLKIARDDAMSKGRRMDSWMRDVQEKEREVDEIRQRFNELPRGHFPKDFRARENFKKDVHRSMEAVKALQTRANEISESIEMFIAEVATKKPLAFSPWHLKNYTSNFMFSIGSGGLGDVYRGKFPNDMQIAVKVIKDVVTVDTTEKQFKAEVSTMGQTYHRNLVKLYGFCFAAEWKALVYEYMEKGSLDKILDENHHSVNWKEIYGIATGTARGLSYLHEHCEEQIIHLDIKAGNILLDSKWRPKVADFGLAKFYSRDKSQPSTKYRGTRIYDAPKVCMEVPTKITDRSDVFSFGMMLFEVLSKKMNSKEQISIRRQVWEYVEKEQLDKVLRDCGIGERDGKMARKLAIVALWCAQDLPDGRPSTFPCAFMLVLLPTRITRQQNDHK